MPTRDVIFSIIGRDETSPAFNRAAASAEGAAARISRAGDRMGVAGRKMTHTLTLPILGIAAASVKAATGFDASMTRIETQAGASRREVQFLTKEVLGMRGAQFGPNAAAASLYHLESVGIRGRKAILDLKQAEDLAAVGGADLAETTNALAGAWRTGIRGARDFHEAAATINAVIGAGNMTLPDLSAALGTGILPTAKTFGLTLKDVGSALALFTDEGVPADMAATRLRMTFSLLGAPTGKAEKQLKSIGITQYQLANDMRRRNGLIVAVGDLKTHLDNSGLSATKQAALLSRAFGGGRSSSAILSLVNNYEVLRKKQEQVTRTLARYDHAVKVQAATPQAQFKRALATLEQTGVLIGRDLLPLVVTGAQDVEHLAKAFDSLSPSQKHVAIDALLVVAALGPVLTIAGRLTKVFGLASTAAVKAATFMAAPYQTTATQAQAAALRVEYANAQLQSDEALTAAAIARAKAAEAAAAETAAVRIAVAAEDSAASMRLLATQAAEDAIEFNYAMQAEALAAQKMAVQTSAAAEAAQLRMSAAMAGATRSTFGLQTAITGLGIGLTVGMFTRGASTSTKLLSSLGAAGLGAAIGLSMGGPLGAAVGGLTAGLSSLATQFIGTGRSANQMSAAALEALAQQKQAADALLSTLQAVNGAYNAQARTTVANSLESAGLLLQGQDFGIKPDQLVSAVLGGNIKRIYRAAQRFLPHTLAQLAQPGAQDKVDEFNKFYAALVQQVQGAAAAEGAYQRVKDGINGATRANDKFLHSSKALTNQFRDTGRDLGPNVAGIVSAFASRNETNIRKDITFLDQHAAAMVRDGKSAQQATHWFDVNEASLKKQLVTIGFNSKAVATLFATYGKPPKRIELDARIDRLRHTIKTAQDTIKSLKQSHKPGIDASIAALKAKIRDAQATINGLHGKTLQTDINLVWRNIIQGRAPRGTGNGISAPGLIGGQPPQAAGTMATFGRRTIPPNTAFTVGERGWEGGVTDAYGRASIFPANQAMAMGFRAPTPYASGTGEHASKPREVRIKDGRVEIDADSQGRLFAVFRGLILDELDYSMGH